MEVGGKQGALFAALKSSNMPNQGAAVWQMMRKKQLPDALSAHREVVISVLLFGVLHRAN